jgi:ParB-like chromosome segregation protein Spo0J
MQIEQIGIDTLIPFAKNSRTHDDAQVAQIAASIKEFGFTNPVLIDETNGIIAGHGRILAARKLNLEQVPTIRLAHLSESQKRAYVIADNKLALNAGWDNEMLALELNELRDLGFDLDLTGFKAEEIQALKMPDFEPGTEDDQGKLDQLDPKWIACPHCGKEFDAREA